MTDHAVKEYQRKIASAGGKARAAKSTPKQRTEWARKAAKARWSKRKERKS